MNHFCETLRIDATLFLNQILNDEGLTDSEKNTIIKDGVHTMHTKKHLIKTGYKELDKETLKTCMVCPSTEGVKRYTPKNDGVFYANCGDGYVEYCTKHAKQNGYIE